GAPGTARASPTRRSADMGVINMAHGEFIMAGAYTAYVTQNVLGSAGLSLVVSLPIAFAIGGALGVVLEAALLRRMYHRPLDTLLDRKSTRLNSSHVKISY